MESRFSQRLLEVFPPPDFLVMSGAGLNISDHSVKVMKLKRKGRGLVVSVYGDEPIEEGVIRNGNISDEEKLIKILSAVRSKYKLGFVRVSIPEEKAYVFKTMVPGDSAGKPEDIRDNLEFQLEEHVPLSSNESIFDYDIIEHEVDHAKDKGHLDVSVSVISQKMVASYMGMMRRAGLTPLSLEIEAESIARAVVSPEELGTYMIVDYGRTRTGISVVSRGTVRYTATLDAGGEIITETFIKHFNVARKEAEEIKAEKGFLKNKQNEEIFSALSEIVSSMTDEIQKRIDFWHTHRDMESEERQEIEKIIMVGGNSNLPGLSEHISTNLRIPVERGNVWKNAFSLDHYIPSIDFGHSLSYASAIGLALNSYQNNRF